MKFSKLLKGTLVKSIQIKISMILIMVTVLILTGFAVINHINTKNEMQSDYEALADQVVKRLSNSLASPLYDMDDAAVIRLIDSEMLEKRIVAVLVKDAEEKKILQGKARDASWNSVENKMEVIGPYLKKSMNIKKDDLKLGSVEIFFTEKFMNAALERAIIDMVFVVLFLIVMLVTVLFISIRITLIKPITMAATGTGQLRIGDLDVVFLSGGDEMGMMGEALNGLVSELKVKAQAADEISKGNLSFNVMVASDKDVLGTALKRMVESLDQIVSELHEAASHVDSGAKQVSDSSQSVSQGATEQASSLEEITSSMTEIGSRTKNNAENASKANQLAVTAKDAGENGVKQVAEMVSAMEDINDSGKEVAKIIKTIDDIAFQTNLLALNAAVEAARAGNHGKGFAVVAQEVRTLAGRSAKAAQETASLIEGSVHKVEAGSFTAEKTSNALGEINILVSDVADLVGRIDTDSNEQALGIDEVNKGLKQIDIITQKNTANADETSLAAKELSQQAGKVRNLLSYFEVRQEIKNWKIETALIHKHNQTKIMAYDKPWGNHNSIKRLPVQK